MGAFAAIVLLTAVTVAVAVPAAVLGAAQLSLLTSTSCSYSLEWAGAPYLTGGDTAIHIGGVWYSARVGNLQLVSMSSDVTGHDSIGVYTETTCLFEAAQVGA